MIDSPTHTQTPQIGLADPVGFSVLDWGIRQALVMAAAGGREDLN